MTQTVAKTITLDKYRNKIRLFTDYSSEVPKACRTVGGAVWNKKVECWEFPLLWPTCLELRRKVATPLGRDFRYTEEMWAWAHEAKSKWAARPKFDDDTLIQLPRIQEKAPQMWDAMKSRPFQTQGVNFFVQNRRGILADDPGLGKTVQVLGAMEEANVTGPVLVVANKSAQQVTWPAQIEQWTSDEYLIFDADIPAKEREAEISQVFLDCEADPTLRIWVLANPYWIKMKAETDDYGKYIYSDRGVKFTKVEIRNMFLAGQWSAIIADESQETLACNTGNAKKQSQQRQGMGALPLADYGMKISISGTPMRGKPENMYGQLSWIAPDIYTGYWAWAKKHFAVDDSGYEGAMVVGELLDEKAFYEECSTFMIRRSKEQVAKDLPPKRYGGSRFDPKDANSLIGVWLPMAKEQEKTYRNFIESGSHMANGLEMNAVGILAETTRMKQFATSCGDLDTELKPRHERYEEDVWESYFEANEDGSDEVAVEERIHEKGDFVLDEKGRKIQAKDPETGELLYDEIVVLQPRLPSNKFDWLVEWLTERDLVGKGHKGTGKVIIASQFRKVIELFREALATKHSAPSFAITGSTSTKERIAQQNEFQQNPNSPKLFFIQTKAGGTSLTLDQADDVIILDEMWNPDNQEQVEDRAHRLSNLNHNVTIWYLRSKDTIEEHIGTTLEERLNTCKGIMDGQRGVDFAKKLYEKDRKKKR